MLQTTEGIILRTVNYSETSIIFDVYTHDFGLRTYIINGVRKKNARVSPALIRPMSLVEMVVYHQEDKDINRIKEIKASYLYQQIPFDVIRGTVALFMTEVAQKSIKESHENTILFHFLTNSFKQLDTTENINIFPTWWLLQLAIQLGIAPDLQHLPEGAIFDFAEGVISTQLPTHPYFISSSNVPILADWSKAPAPPDIKLPNQQRQLLFKELLSFYQYHIENFGVLNSVEVLHAVFHS